MKNTAALFLIPLLLSCSSSLVGSFFTGVTLSEKNFIVIKTISGKASAESFLGYIPGRPALYAQAKADMIEKSGYVLAGKSRALVNVTVDYRKSWFLFMQYVECTITADVIEFK